MHSVYFSIFSLNVSISVARSVTFETSAIDNFFDNEIMVFSSQCIYIYFALFI